MTDDRLQALGTAFRDHQILAFLGLAFGWSWLVWFAGIALGYGATRWLQAVGAWGPLFAGAAVTTAAGGDPRAWARQVIPKRVVDRRWYGVAVVAPLALTQTGAVIGWLTGVPVAVVDATEVVTTFLFTLVVGGSLEEFGWRGFLQPRLQERRSALFAALAVGLVWALWHAPLVVGGTGAGYESGDLVGLVVGLPLFSVVLAWLYNSTRGGLAFAMLFHATINATPVVEAREVTALMELGELAVLLGLPLGIVLFYDRAYLAAAHPDPRIPGTRAN